MMPILPGPPNGKIEQQVRAPAKPLIWTDPRHPEEAAEIVEIKRLVGMGLRVVDIQRHVAEHFGLTMAELLSPRRIYARPRQIAMYLCKVLTQRSYPAIGRMFMGRDHTTVLYSCRAIAALIQADPEIATTVAELRAELEARQLGDLGG